MAGEVIAGRYELEELVGSGGMSSVYRAYDRQLERRVALKILHERLGADDEHVSRFRHEARAVAQLSHPNVVTVIDRGSDGGRQFIVFEYVDGENLRQLLDRTGRLPARRALEIGICVADGLAYAHERGVVHRDVKPQNVLLGRDGEVKVTDFGIARSLDAESGLTLTGTVLGTSNYLSPEQASGKHVTKSADVYSLGVLLFELLSGEVPFPGGNQVVVALKHVNEEAPPLRNVPPRVAAAVARALEKEPGRRFPSMADFAEELRACLAGLDAPEAERTVVAPAAPAAAQATRVLPRERPRRSSRVAVVAVFAAVAVAAAAVVLVLTAGHGGSPAGSGGGGAGAVTLRGITGYDPQGTGAPGEHDAAAPLATDGNEATFWATETYDSPAFGGLKSGVGLVLDAGSAVKLGAVTVTTDTPGFSARILAGDSPSGGFADDSASQTAGSSTTFRLDGATARYYVVWITRLPPGDVAHLNEVTAG
ncbi:MAG TPA: protein kinase [Gaiellaceae bacterium]|nr:protein kinase [Gaiellaceae bacterium]